MKHKGRGIDHVWEVVKFKDDLCWYAKCKCGFVYPCSKNKRNDDGSFCLIQVMDKSRLFNYCPNCGARKLRYNPDIKHLDKYLWGYPYDEDEKEE